MTARTPMKRPGSRTAKEVGAAIGRSARTVRRHVAQPREQYEATSLTRTKPWEDEGDQPPDVVSAEGRGPIMRRDRYQRQAYGMRRMSLAIDRVIREPANVRAKRWAWWWGVVAGVV